MHQTSGSTASSINGGNSTFSTTTKKSNREYGFSSFNTYSEDPVRPSFGAKGLRFDGQLELKGFFNRDPGPGTYSESASTVESSLASEMKQIKEMSKMAILQKKDINVVQSSFLSKQKKFLPIAEL
jgi:hypothetical protein